MLPAYIDAYGNVRHYAVDRGPFATAIGDWGLRGFGQVTAEPGDEAAWGAAHVLVSNLRAYGLNFYEHAHAVSSLREFQRAAGLAADGVYGPATYAALRRREPSAPPPETINPAPPPDAGGSGGATPARQDYSYSPPPATVAGASRVPWVIGGLALAGAVGLFVWGGKKRKGRRG
jgi:hypothetical protein